MGNLGLRIAGKDDGRRQAGTSESVHGPFRPNTPWRARSSASITDSGYLHLDYNGKTCAYVRMDLLESDFPQWEFDAEWTPPELRGLTEPVLSEPTGPRQACCKGMLARPNLCARNWIARQYDHEVQGGSVIKPLVGRSNATSRAMRRWSDPSSDSRSGLAVTQALNPFYSQIDTYHMTAATIDEAVRRVLAVGGDPDHLGGVDNFCWPTIQYDPHKNPDGKYKAAQLVRSNWALRDYCLAYRHPTAFRKRQHVH